MNSSSSKTSNSSSKIPHTSDVNQWYSIIYHFARWLVSISYIVASLFLNTKLLTPGIFTKRPLLSFFIHWIAWILLYFLTYLPTLLNSKNILWEFIVFNYVVLGSVNFFLFYLIAFYVLPKIGIKQKKMDMAYRHMYRTGFPVYVPEIQNRNVQGRAGDVRFQKANPGPRSNT